VVQPEPQVPVQLVLAAHCEVQLLAQATLHVFMCEQSKVTLEGAFSEPPSTALPEVPAPRLQVPPAAQLQVVSVQLQAPVQCSGLGAVQPLTMRNALMISERMVELRGTKRGGYSGYSGIGVSGCSYSATSRIAMCGGYRLML
jgi:hypothetical protein